MILFRYNFKLVFFIKVLKQVRQKFDEKGKQLDVIKKIVVFNVMNIGKKFNYL